MLRIALDEKHNGITVTVLEFTFLFLEQKHGVNLQAIQFMITLFL